MVNDMNPLANIPTYVIDAVRRPPPGAAGVIEGTTPVVSFGDPMCARVATLSINPSSNEFLDAKGAFLPERKRRLATLASIGAHAGSKLTDEQVRAVVQQCATYFHRNPYRGWFNHLDRILRDSLSVSYYEDSACHLDLSPWATSPKWQHLDDDARGHLLLDGTELLMAQLSLEHIRVVVVNGRAVWNQLAAIGLVDIEEVARLPFGNGAHTPLLVGKGLPAPLIGWTLNVQRAGMTTADRARLCSWLRAEAKRR
jgi:hypothetical protein